MGLSLKDRLPASHVAKLDDGGEVLMYRVGGLSMSVCAPGDATAEQIATAINRHHPCGTEHGWSVSKDATFRTGETNPCSCEEDASRKHWLIDC